MERIPYKPGCKKYQDAVKKIYGTIPPIPEGWKCTGVGVTQAGEYWIAQNDEQLPDGPLGHSHSASPKGRINLMPISGVPMGAMGAFAKWKAGIV